MNICLPKFAAAEFKTRIKNGTINPARLSNMTSAERRAFFSEFMSPENAQKTNALFESKLLLQDQQRGMITWAKQVTGITPEARRDILTRVHNMKEVLQPKELDSFLEDLAAQRLGMSVSVTEAARIAKLAERVRVAKEAMEQGGDRLVYGRAKVAFTNYVEDLKRDATGLSVADFKANPLAATGKAVSNVAGQMKSVTASLDNSAIFNQGWKTLWTNPVIWQRNARKTFSDIFKTLGGKNAMDMVKAEVVSRPTYDLMQKAKLAVGTVEEAFPTALPERVPVLGRVYKASQDAYTGFLYRTRADVFDKMIKIADKQGLDLSKAELESIGSMVNSLTGRGGFGRYEGSLVDATNNILFSPRFLKSQVDVLIQPITGAGGSNFVRKQAALNLLKVIGGTATVLGIANAVKPGSVEWDPRSSDFGTIKIGNTRFSVNGGLAAVITLASRLGTMSTKSSTTDKVRDLHDGKYGADTAKDVFVNFFFNKAAPAAAFFRDMMEGRDFDGNEFTVGGGLLRTITPFPVSTYQDLAKDPNSANDLLAMIASGLGINVSNYGPK